MTITVKGVMIEEHIFVVFREPVESALLGVARKVNKHHSWRIFLESIKADDCIPLALSSLDNMMSYNLLMNPACPNPE